jgi:hypothetical protein
LTSNPRIPSASRRESTLSRRSIPSHATSDNPQNSYHHSTSTYQALTPQALHEHEHPQLSLQQTPTYLHTVHVQHNNQFEAGFNGLGVDLHDSVFSKVIQQPVGMTPLELFEVDSTYPYQQYNSYQPILPPNHNSYHEGQYANVTHQSEAQCHHNPASVHVAVSNPGDGQEHEVVYYAPQQDYYIPTTANGEAASPGNDLAAVGTQFDGHVPSGYAQTF